MSALPPLLEVKRACLPPERIVQYAGIVPTVIYKMIP
jgi:hypothetical protein